MGKIYVVELVKTKADDKEETYDLVIQGIEHNKMLMASVTYRGKTLTVSQTPLQKIKKVFHFYGH